MNDYYESWFSFLKPKQELEIKLASEQTGLPKETLELYHGFIHNHWKGALKKMFPRLRDVCSINWDEIYQEYYHLYSPSSWDMNEMTFSFPKFLEQKNYDPYLVELAKYEVIEFQVYKKPALKPVDRENLRINPTVIIEMFNFRIAEWVRLMDQDESYYNSSPEPGENILAIGRDFETHMCKFTVLGNLDLAILEIIKQVPICRKNKVSEIKEGLEYLQIKADSEHIISALNTLERQHLIF